MTGAVQAVHIAVKGAAATHGQRQDSDLMAN